ncbi:MAG TPA: hypothetical protein DCG19_04600 [Cryomorphaceae bacterium]|nr:hypothetical protein [Owenweeksia sp.]MBF99321.1 hypothetical protein [Owenweeksia sp.]HAD96662.1 hypothetical protein [Cryomorphaceae bacterium]HCQ17171.1 hypothetical protein [Cryomorphaceae bacterium]|tara:strand:- start:3047 stop:4072 length:1026 start_codon:yes stop_codon:yes gene_type:complete
MKRFLLKLLGLIPFFLIIGAVNYSIDSKNYITENEQLNEAAEQIMAGKLIATRERLLQHDFVKRYIDRRGKKDEVNVMGSSKCMVIDSSFFPRSSFFNYYVSNSSFVEYLAITYWLDEKDLLPDTLIMELSLSQFHNMYTGQPEYYYDACKTFCNQLNIPPPDMEGSPHKSAAYHLFSLSYFFLNLQQNKSEKYFVTRDPHLKNHFVLQPDGSLWVGQYLQLSKEEKKRRVQDPTADKLEWIKNLDPNVKQGFRALIEFLQSKHTTVILYLPPYHPETYRLYVKDNPLFEELNSLSNELQSEYKLEKLGAYNPYELQLDDRYFYDALHISKEGFAKIWESD